HIVLRPNVAGMRFVFHNIPNRPPSFAYRGEPAMPARLVAVALLGLFPLAMTASANTSNSLMDVSHDGSRLIVANADNGTVSIVDTKERKVLHEIKVGDKPEGVTWLGKTDIALVTVYREDKVVFIDAAKGKAIHTLNVDDEPYGIVATKDGTEAYVTNEY